jgi:hypothetical protein
MRTAAAAGRAQWHSSCVTEHGLPVWQAPLATCRCKGQCLRLQRFVRKSIMSHVNPIQIQKFLKGVDYPASKATLIENAKKMGADENVCASLEDLPEQDFDAPVDVSEALGKQH